MKTFRWGVLCGLLVLIAACGFSLTEAAEPLQGESFVPQPGLRIFHKGILGSDGTRYDGSLVTARLDGDALATSAEETLTYYEYKQPPIDAAKNRAVWKYVATTEGIDKAPLVSRWKAERFFWLPKIPEVGVQWKTSWGRRREVMQTNLTVETEAGVFEGCIMVEHDVYAGGTGIERHYLAPGVGLVKILSLKGPTATKSTVWYEVTRIERVDPAQARQIVETLLK